VETSLQIVHDISTENIGTMCINKQYSPLKIPLNTERYDGARQKSDLASVILQDLGFNKHSGELLAIYKIFSASNIATLNICIKLNFMIKLKVIFLVSPSLY
jgi:hypothetical protein